MNTLLLKENLKKYTCLEECPIRNVISRFSGKWSILVLCVVAENKTARFSAISKAIPDISSKVLTETLKHLEADGFIIRTIYAEIPPRVEYSLTSLGQSLLPVIGSMVAWAIEHFDEVVSKKKH